jgi:hypothetical protein
MLEQFGGFSWEIMEPFSFFKRHVGCWLYPPGFSSSVTSYGNDDRRLRRIFPQFGIASSGEHDFLISSWCMKQYWFIDDIYNDHNV